MTRQELWREEFQRTLDHIVGAFQRCSSASGPTQPLSAPDVHKISEGLFVSAWTHWEEFLRQLFLHDLADSTDGVLRKEIRTFRLKRSHDRMALLMLDHPDEQRWISWSDTAEIISRADRLLADGHRFDALRAHQQDLQKLKAIRNAIAHKGDPSRGKFLRLISDAPFSLTASQRKGITVGRFLSSHRRSGAMVLEAAVGVLRSAAESLVPP